MPKAVEVALAVLTIALASGSIWICVSAARTLGKQWTFVARVVEGHRLITDGPYRFVRNPIYAGMLGMTLATNLAVSRWWVAPITFALFLIGNRFAFVVKKNCCVKPSGPNSTTTPAAFRQSCPAFSSH